MNRLIAWLDKQSNDPEVQEFALIVMVVGTCIAISVGISLAFLWAMS